MEQLYFEPFSGDGGLIPPPDRLRKILVVGAGVAGLQTARQLLKLGCQVLVLETNDEVGGVWIRNYIGYGLQVPWKLYQFPEYPWPKDLQPSSEYPTGQEVQEYIRAYCREYNLRDHIRFNCKLLRLRWCPNTRQWDALYCDTAKEKFFKVTVDYTVICAGIYSQPYIPDYEGTDAYAGIQLHAKDFVDLSLARGRRVVIVGAGKTALDCVSSIVATNTATSVTLLYRQAHWPLPRRMLGTTVRRLLFNRAMTKLIPPYYTAGRSAHVVDRAVAPIKKLFWRGIQGVISRKFRITEQMRPRVHLPTDLFYGGQILDNTLDKLVRSEALLTVKGEINRFVRNGVILQDGNFVAADLVLYCTGYLKTYEYLEGDMRARLDLQKDGLYLYRNCLPYAVPHLAFIGSEVSTYNNILTHGLQALWLAHMLSGRTPLPPVAAMVDDVRAQQRWRRSVMPAQRSRGSVLMVYMMQYHDQLLEDMGHRSHRKGLNFLSECFGTYTAVDYRVLMEREHSETDAARQRAAEQLAAEGVPPAVLQAAAAGRNGLVTPTAAAAPPLPPPPPSAMAPAAGSGGGVGAAANGRPPAICANSACGTSMTTMAAASAAPAAPVVSRYSCVHGIPLDDRVYGSSRGGTSFSVRSGGGYQHDSDSAYSNPAGGGAGACGCSGGSIYSSPGLAASGPAAAGGGQGCGAMQAAMAAHAAAFAAALPSNPGRLSDFGAENPGNAPDALPQAASLPQRLATQDSSTSPGGEAAVIAPAAAAAAAASMAAKASDIDRGRHPVASQSEHWTRSRRSAEYRSTSLRMTGEGGGDGPSDRCHAVSSELRRSPETPAPAPGFRSKLHDTAPSMLQANVSERVHIRPSRNAPSARAATTHGYCTASSSGWVPSQASPPSRGVSPSARAPAAGCRSFTTRACGSPGVCGSRDGAGGPSLLLVPSSPSRLSRHTGPSSPPPQAPRPQLQVWSSPQAPGSQSEGGSHPQHARVHGNEVSVDTAASNGGQRPLDQVYTSICGSRCNPANAVEDCGLLSSPGTRIRAGCASDGGAFGAGTASPRAAAPAGPAVEAGPPSAPNGEYSEPARHVTLTDGSWAFSAAAAPAGPYNGSLLAQEPPVNGLPASGAEYVGGFPYACVQVATGPLGHASLEGADAAGQAAGDVPSPRRRSLLAESGRMGLAAGTCTPSLDGDGCCSDGGGDSTVVSLQASPCDSRTQQYTTGASADIKNARVNSSSQFTACVALGAMSTSSERSHRLSSRSSGDSRTSSTVSSGSSPATDGSGGVGDGMASALYCGGGCRTSAGPAAAVASTADGGGEGLQGECRPRVWQPDGVAAGEELRRAGIGGARQHAALVNMGSRATLGSLGSGASGPQWHNQHRRQQQADSNVLHALPSAAAVVALAALPDVCGGNVAPRPFAEASSRPMLDRLPEEDEDRLSLRSSASEQQVVLEMAGVTKTGLLVLPPAEATSAVGSAGHLFGPPPRLAAMSADNLGRGGSASSTGGLFRGRAGGDRLSLGAAGGPLPDSDSWQQLLPGGFSGCGGHSTGSSGALYNSSISLAAGIAVPSSVALMMSAGCFGSVGGGVAVGPPGGEQARLSPLSRSHTFGETSASLGNWVGQAAAALAGDSCAAAAGNVDGGDDSSPFDRILLYPEGSGTRTAASPKLGPGGSGATAATASMAGAVATASVQDAAALMAMADTSPFSSPSGPMYQ